jgi:excinuclease ABC subunit C
LESIPGIGEKTVIELLTHFKSTKRIAEAGLDDLAKVIGISKAKKIVMHFQ